MPLEEIRALEAALGSDRAHPRDAKRRLAREITRRYHGEAAALAAEAEFDRVFGSRELPEEIPDVTLGRDRLRGGRIRLARLLVETGLADSNTDARRLISQGGVSLDRSRVHEDLEVEVRDGLLVQVGRRRFARVRLGE